MASTSSQLRGLVLSASEIRELTGWSDAMVEDYLNILSNLITLADSIDAISVTDGVAETLNFPIPFLSERPVPDTVSTGSDYTTLGDQRIICTNLIPITVTLNGTPNNLESVDITRASAEMTISGNGRTISGEPDVLVNAQYSSLHLVYVLEVDEWIIS